MNAVGLAEQESGKAVGFYCAKCGRLHVPTFGVQFGLDENEIVRLHTKAEACCTVVDCPKHGHTLYDGEPCPKCVIEGPEASFPKPASVGELHLHEVSGVDGQRLTSSDGCTWTHRPKRARKEATK
jgi:hypothetical protein